MNMINVVNFLLPSNRIALSSASGQWMYLVTQDTAMVSWQQLTVDTVQEIEGWCACDRTRVTPIFLTNFLKTTPAMLQVSTTRKTCPEPHYFWLVSCEISWVGGQSPLNKSLFDHHDHPVLSSVSSLGSSRSSSQLTAISSSWRLSDLESCSDQMHSVVSVSLLWSSWFLRQQVHTRSLEIC